MSALRAASRHPPVQPCPLERYLEVVSGTWIPRILWYLLERPYRFGELRQSIDGVSAKVLASKLRALERQNIVERTVIPSSPPQVTYSLSERGQALEPVFRAMEKAARRLFPEPPSPANASRPATTRSKVRTRWSDERTSDERASMRADDKGSIVVLRAARKSRSAAGDR